MANAEAIRFFEQVAADELGIRERAPTTKELAKQFEKAVRLCGAFAWMGVVAGKDPHHRRTVEVYLSERTGAALSEKAEVLLADAIDMFDELALSLEPQLDATLHLIKEAECPPPELKKRLKHRCKESGDCALVWDETL